MTIQIETERLRLRPPRTEDAPRVAELMSDKHIPWNLGRAPWPYELADAEGWIERGIASWADGTDYPFAIIHEEEGLIGSCGVVPVTDDVFELGYWIGKPYWGQGYVTEASAGLLKWAKTSLGIQQFVSGHINDNPGSGRVLRKLGFEPVGEATHYVPARDCDVEATRYVLGAPAEIAIESVTHYARPET